MTRTSRDSTGLSRSAVPADAAPAAGDLRRADDATLLDLISGGSGPAFVTLFDRTLAAARAELTAEPLDTGRCSEILAATYVEVWWLARCRRTPAAGVTDWITGIVRRRVHEASGEHPAALEVPRPTYAELEVAALLRRPVSDLLRT